MQLQVITQDARGINDAKKKKLFINKYNETLKENPSTIIAMQETHFKKEDADGMKIMARFTSHHSTYDNDGNRQKGASTFFSESFWTESESLYNSDNGDLVISRLKNDNLSFIIVFKFKQSSYLFSLKTSTSPLPSLYATN